LFGQLLLIMLLVTAQSLEGKPLARGYKFSADWI
jgi:hypothetical protein